MQSNPFFSNIVNLAEMLYQQAGMGWVSFGCEKENGLIMKQTIIFLKEKAAYHLRPD